MTEKDICERTLIIKIGGKGLTETKRKYNFHDKGGIK